MFCYTYYVPHATPLSIVEVDGVSHGYAGLDWTGVQRFIISFYPSFYHLLLNPFHLGESKFILYINNFYTLIKFVFQIFAQDHGECSVYVQLIL